jgi:hypothetical protein
LETGQCSECIKLQLTHETVFRSFNAPAYRKFYRILNAGTYLKKFLNDCISFLYEDFFLTSNGYNGDYQNSTFSRKYFCLATIMAYVSETKIQELFIRVLRLNKPKQISTIYIGISR